MSGTLIDVRTLSIPHSATLHDFAVTSRHLVFLAPPLALSPERIRAGLPFGAACEWRPSLGLRVVVVDLCDWSEQRFELPASNVFHIGNAWEDDDGVIRLDCMRDDQPRAMLAGWTLMKGEYVHHGGTRMTLITINTRKGSVDCHTRDDLEGEYPVVAAEEIGQRYRQVVFARRSAQRAARSATPSSPALTRSRALMSKKVASTSMTTVLDGWWRSTSSPATVALRTDDG